jgi:hypothetical protein
MYICCYAGGLYGIDNLST